MADHVTRPDVRVPGRRPIAVGIIRRHAGRTFTVRSTAAGVTGRITRTPVHAAHGPQEDSCPICCNWTCTCPPYTGGAR